jgi:hypothetical protein
MKAVLIGLLACLAVYGQSANGVTFVQPVITPSPAPAPTPGGTTAPPLNVNQKLAQALNMQDFDSAPTLSCTSVSHDDGPALQRAINYAAQVGAPGEPSGPPDSPPPPSANGTYGFAGGVVSMRNSSTCYVNSIQSQVNGVILPLTPYGLKIQGNGSHLILNPALSSNVLLSTPPDYAGGAGFDSATTPVYFYTGNLPAYSSSIQLATPSDCANFKPSDPIWIRGGYGKQSENNGELNRVKSCDATAGILYPYWNTAKPYIPGGSATPWTPGAAHTAGQTIRVGRNVYTALNSGTSGTTTPLWRSGGIMGVGAPANTIPPARVGDGAGVINTTGTAICSTNPCTSQITITGSTAGIVPGMLVTGNSGLDAESAGNNGVLTPLWTVMTISGSVVTLNQPINFYDVCDFVGGVCQPAPLQFYPPGAVIWSDQGYTNITNASKQALQNFEIDDLKMTVSTEGGGVIVLSQMLGVIFRNVEMENTVGNQWMVDGANRNVLFDHVKWTSPVNHGAESGAGGQIAYNTVNFEVRNSEFFTQGWIDDPIWCDEYSAQVNLHDNRLGGSASVAATTFCFDYTVHHNQIDIDASASTTGGGAISFGGCCGSISIPNMTIDDNVFNIAVNPAVPSAGMYVAGTNMRFHHNTINYTGGYVPIDLTGAGGDFSDNIVNSDGPVGVYMGSFAPNWTLTNNIVTRTNAITAVGLSVLNSNSVAVSSVQNGTIVAGMFVAGFGIPPGTFVGPSPGSSITLVDSTGASVNNYAALSLTPLVFGLAGDQMFDNNNGFEFIANAVVVGSGPTITGNTIANFKNGIFFEMNGADFPNRVIGINNFNNTSQALNAGVVNPMTYGPLSSINFNAPFNPHFSYQFYGRTHLWAFGPQLPTNPLGINPNTGAPVDNSESLSLDSSSFNTLGIHSGVETNLVIRFSTPGYQTTIAQGSLAPASAGGLAFGTMTLGSPNSTQANRFGISSLGVQVLSGGTYMSNDGSSGATDTVSTGSGTSLCTLTFKSGLFVGAAGAGCAITVFTQNPTGAVFNSPTVPPVQLPVTSVSSPGQQ